ncbi:MAG: ABC transporter permease, partial [Planctomycetaceae bacterium]|nr:ABC transporter permease [Planctomycetaceae bacterium]
MSFHHILLLLKREIRDQLRDRRMLFMMFVLPLLLYPVMGVTFFQAGQFTQQTPSRIIVFLPDNIREAGVGSLPPLFETDDDGNFADQLHHSLFTSPDKQRLLQLRFQTMKEKSESLAEAKQEIERKQYDAALVIPPMLFDDLRQKEAGVDSLQPPASSLRPPATAEASQPVIVYTTANEKSRIAQSRLRESLNRWNQLLGEANLKRHGLPSETASPLVVQSNDIAEKTEFHGASFWSNFLPVLLLIWALTGAFYPSIDLCAGEKERGTLETLLSSPASRVEIVLSKLLTVMTFSVLTSMLNILCVGATAYVLVAQLTGVGLPPRLALLWLALALIPSAALFSALCIALASYAKSSKEGQYYLTPLLLIVMPLVLLPMSPGQELNLGMSLVPVSGIVLELATLIEGDYARALQYLPVVLLVTLGCCVVAIRWAVDQFNSEGVLFRESEKFNLKKWLVRLLKTRLPRPTPQAALLCGFVILSLKYFANLAVHGSSVELNFVLNVLLAQLGIILLPVIFLTAMTSSSIRETLRLAPPKWRTIPLAFLLAVCWHPVTVMLERLVLQAYPVSPEIFAMLEQLRHQLDAIPIWLMFLLIAVLPGICEEIAFRGYILTGLDTPRHRLRAIVITSIFFGATHAFLQQSMMACLTGIVLAWLALRTGSIWPGVVFHITNNSIGVLLQKVTEENLNKYEWLRTWIGNPEPMNDLAKAATTQFQPGLLYGTPAL